MHPIFERRTRRASRAAVADLPATPAERVFAAVVIATMLLTSAAVMIIG